MPAQRGCIRSLLPFSLAVTTLLGGCARGPETPADAWTELAHRDADRPLNVVLVTIDTLRADRLGCYGAERATTPNIDALAAEGVRFANAATTVPFTLPAHSSLMTGTYPPYHGVRENVGYRLDEGLPTLAETLADGGYATGGFVSAFVLDARWGIARGFDEYFDDFDPSESASGNLGAVQRDGAETVAAAVRWLDEARPDPFFLWLHLFEPHDPYTPPEPYASRHPGRPYDGEVAYADALVGRLRRALEERGLLEHSLVVLTGDHGEGLGQHREGFHGFFVYDSTVHVPLIVRPPFADGRVLDAAVSHVDLMPTVLELLGRPLPETTQGRSLLPLLRGESETDERMVYTESMYPLVHYGWAPLRSLRTRDHKFIDAPRPELYDLGADPHESENVVQRNRRLYADLERRLDAMVESLGRDGRSEAAPASLDEDTLAQLQALGYLAGRGGVSIADEDARERADPKDRIDLHQLVMMAQSDLGKGELDAARQRLAEALARDASMVDAHQMLGSIAMQQEDPATAASHFRSALEVKADHTASLFGLANAYRRMGRVEDALLGFERLLQIDPGDVKAISGAAEMLHLQGRREEATARLEEAVTGADPPALLLNQLGELRSLEGDRAGALGLFERALEIKPELVVARFNLAVLSEESGRLGRAEALYEEVIAQAPKHFQAQFNLGRLMGASGRSDRQLELWEAAIESNPDFARGYFFLAKLLMERGDLERAERLAREGLERDPEHRAGPLGYYVLADILNRRGQPRAAAAAAETGRRLEGP